ncbi:hypothetical protein LFML04_1393 [Leptospirillum ferriphilum ML-04]|uniref:Tetratricopeptide repeat protein n=1 Tax=Leptospirillum ferriphilum (strain ML-04) TaxID=1048260 RepID=J9ZBP3_LEPFM|nr:hypothetical protein LFML04_1393 [Leptospirillum ferriphilum ML-04]
MDRLHISPPVLLKSSIFLILSSCLLFLDGCVQPSQPPPPPRKHVKHIRTRPEWLQKMKNDEKAGNFSLAMADLESAQNTREKTYWTRHILRKWSLFDLERAKALQKSGHSADAAFLLGEVFKRSPDFLENPPKSLSPGLFRDYLLNQIENDQEMAAMRQMDLNALLSRDEKKEITFNAYLHLTKRRMSEEKFHYAMLDLKKALALNPTSPEALSLRSRLFLQAKKWTDKGYQAFADQNLHRAIYFWKRAQEIRPDDKSLAENIQKAQKLQERLQEIEKETGHSSPDLPLHTP